VLIKTDFFLREIYTQLVVEVCDIILFTYVGSDYTKKMELYDLDMHSFWKFTFVLTLYVCYILASKYFNLIP